MAQQLIGRILEMKILHTIVIGLWLYAYPNTVHYHQPDNNTYNYVHVASYSLAISTVISIVIAAQTPGRASKHINWLVFNVDFAFMQPKLDSS